MEFYELLEQVLDLLQRRGRVSYRALKVQFHLDDDYLAALQDELIDAQRLASDEDGKVLVWTGYAAPIPPTRESESAPLAYTPPHLTEKILATRSALEGERKQVTVLFADLKGSTELIRDLDPEQARAILDPALHAMMEAVHRYEGTVNRVLGDGIMALFGAPLAHEDHAARACYAALAMQDALRRYAEEVRHNPRDLVQRIVEVAHPRQIILLGSAARGEMEPHSDIDVLVVVPDGTHCRHAAQRIYQHLIGLGVAVDVVVATESDLQQYGNNFSLVYYPALREGRPIYAA